MTARGRDWYLLVQKGLGHGARIQLVIFVSVRDEAGTGLARKVWDTAMDKEVSMLLTDLALVVALNTCNLMTLHADPQLSFKHHVP